MLLFLAAVTMEVSRMDFFVGTYTSAGGSQGIYRSTLNPTTGEISAPILVAETRDPSFLGFAPGGRFAFAVNESTGGEVSSFAVEPKGWRMLSTQNSGAGGPCHLSVDRTSQNLLVAGYGGGNLACLPVGSDGMLGPMSSFFQSTGSGPDKSRQAEPHVHSTYLSPDNRFVYACNLGTDEIMAFRFDPPSGKLTHVNPVDGAPPGAGPRHIAFSKSGEELFANNEMQNSLSVYRRNLEDGTLTRRQTLSTLEHEVANTSAELVAHPNGRFLYVSNRGDDSIAVFEILTDGLLRRVEVVKAGVKEPRGLDIDPSGHWLVAAGQTSNDLTSLKVDPASGRLTPGPNHVALSKPVCIVFPPAASDR